MSTAPRRWTRHESEASESVLQEMMGVNVSTKKKVSFKSREPLRDDGGLDGSANGDLLETGSASSEVGGGGTTSKQSDVASTVPPPTGTPAAAHRDIGDSPRAELTVVGQRSLVYLLWLVGGVGLGLLCIYVAFGSVEFGDPLDSTNPRQLYCAMMCAIFWSGLATACYLSLVHELLIKRRLYADLELPTIPHLAVRFLSTPVVGGGVLFGTWVAIYQGYKTMLPFHGTLGAVVSLLVGSLYLWVTLLPKVYYVDRPALPRIVFFGTFGLIMGGVVVPIVIYWIVLVFYELAVKSGGIGSQIVVLLVFQVTKIALIQYEIWVFRAVLGPVSDSLCDMLAISIVSILHNSFFSVAVEASHDYVAVIVAILGNAVYASHRTLVLNYNVDFVRYAQVEMLMPAWRRVRRAVWGASGGRATHLQQHQVRTVAVVGSSDEACSDTPSLTSSQAALALDEANRAYLVLQFLSWEVYKFIVPLMYLCAVHIIYASPNRVWLAGIGRTAYQYTESMDRPGNLQDLAQKLLVLTGCDLFILLVESLFLRGLGIDLVGVLCFTCKQVGLPMALMLAFLPLHNICIISIPCGMDFTFKFGWLEYGNTYFKDVAIVST